jgi:hypothetical protein
VREVPLRCYDLETVFFGFLEALEPRTTLLAVQRLHASCTPYCSRLALSFKLSHREEVAQLLKRTAGVAQLVGELESRVLLGHAKE